MITIYKSKLNMSDVIDGWHEKKRRIQHVTSSIEVETSSYGTSCTFKPWTNDDDDEHIQSKPCNYAIVVVVVVVINVAVVKVVSAAATSALVVVMVLLLLLMCSCVVTDLVAVLL